VRIDGEDVTRTFTQVATNSACVRYDVCRCQGDDVAASAADAGVSLLMLCQDNHADSQTAGL